MKMLSPPCHCPFEPSVEAIAVPVCKASGCGRMAWALSKRYEEECKRRDEEHAESHRCVVCQSRRGWKRCTGCRSLGSVSWVLSCLKFC